MSCPQPSRLSALVLAYSLPLLTPDSIAAQRAFVASYGSDTNAASSCLQSAPCRTFTAAMGAVDSRGEIIALDAAGYGPVRITKSVTIAANPGFFAGITDSVDVAVRVDVFEGGGPVIVLRGLHITGQGAYIGVTMHQAGMLIVENCIVSNFRSGGISVTGGAARIANTSVSGNGLQHGSGGIVVSSGSVVLNNVRMTNNFGAGLAIVDSHAVVVNSDSTGNTWGFLVEGFSGSPARLNLRGSSASHNNVGVKARGPYARISVAESLIAGNQTGFENDGGTFRTFGDNILRFNTTPTVGTITPVSGQ